MKDDPAPVAARTASDRSRPDRPALRLDRVTRSFGTVTALTGLDLEVQQGEVVGLLGHNGAGKTTTVRLLAGVLVADRGTVEVAGLDPVADGPAVRRRLGVLPAAAIVDGRLTARANLRFAADVFGMPTAGLEQRIGAALEAFGLTDRADARVEGFSTGMRQRLSLARILLPEPEILLLDEPTAALDPVAARQVRDLVAALARDQGSTVLLCTHDLSEAQQLCDRVVVLEHGQVVASGAPAALAAAHGTGELHLEVAPDQVDAVRAHLAAVATSVRVEGAGRLRAAGVVRERVPSVLDTLVHAGVAIYEARRLDPTLEDVYLALHDRTSDTGRVATEAGQ